MGSTERDLQKRFAEIVQDRTSGSNELLLNLIEASLDFFRSEGAFFVIYQQQLQQAIEDLETFASLVNFQRDFGKGLSADNSNAEIIEWLENARKQVFAVAKQNASVLSQRVLERADSVHILTLSNSFTVYQTLIQLAKGIELIVYQAESRPLMEGLRQGSRLAEAGIEVKIIVDASIPRFLHICDLVVLGADGIYPTGFVNKMGSLSAALAANEFAKPLYVLADLSKINTGMPAEEHSRDPEEIDPYISELENVEALNYYFEVIPHKYVTGYILNGEIKTAREIF